MFQIVLCHIIFAAWDNLIELVVKTTLEMQLLNFWLLFGPNPIDS